MLSQADKDKVGLVNLKVNAHMAMSHFFTQQNPFNQVEDRTTFLQGVYFPVAYLFPNRGSDHISAKSLFSSSLFISPQSVSMVG